MMFPLLLLAAQAAAPSVEVKRVQASAPFRRATADLDRGFARYVDEIVELTEIPSPPFKEARRAAVFADKLRALGLEDVTIDPEGNVTGLRRGTDPSAKLLVVAAHMDTVFPEGTTVKVKREGTRLSAPGVGDDTRGLANMLAYIRALKAAEIRTRRPILFVGTVGEEGRGDLRGARYLLTKGSYRDRIGGFVAIDGNNAARVTHGAVGSKRYHVVFKGPGGHSYGAFGIVNPMSAMAGAIAGLYRIALPAKPKTTYAASVVGGGTSVNAIPSEVFVDVDMRSEDPAALTALERQFVAVVDAAVAAENSQRSVKQGKIAAELQPIGDRPAGVTPRTDPLIETVAASVTANGFAPQYEFSSTDSNIAMSMNIPAVTIGTGGKGERSHSLDEWTDVDKAEGVRGMTVGLLALVAAAGLDAK